MSASFSSDHASSVATDVANFMPIFNFGAERMLVCAAAEGMNTVTPGDGSTQ